MWRTFPGCRSVNYVILEQLLLPYKPNNMHKLSNTKGLDLGQETIDDLKILLKNELYLDIDSQFANEIDEELENRSKVPTIINFSKKGEIDPEKVKQTVYNRIDFEISEVLWDEIDTAFGDCWNNVIGIRGCIYEGQIEQHIYSHLKSKKIIIDYEKVEIITKIIFDYISITGGLLDD